MQFRAANITENTSELLLRVLSALVDSPSVGVEGTKWDAVLDTLVRLAEPECI